MSMGMYATGARVKDAPRTSAHCATNKHSKNKVSAAVGGKRRSTMKVGVLPVVECHHLSLRVLPNDPDHTVLDQYLHQKHNYYGLCVKKKDHCL